MKFPWVDDRATSRKPERGHAKVRIGRVTIPLRDKPPGARVDISAIENGAISHGVMQICEVVVSIPYSANDFVVYERVS